MSSSKSPILKYCPRSRLLKYRSCFNTDEESEIDTDSIGNYRRRDSYSDMSEIDYLYSKIAGRSPDDKENTEKSNQRVLQGYVGFANLPNQVYWKAVAKGFKINIMIVGQSGLGKSTLINSLFVTDIYSEEYPGPTLRAKKTVAVEVTKVFLQEGGINLQLTVIDTPGFGDAVNNNNCWESIIQYIEGRYEEYFQSEIKVKRVTIEDNLVHCCLYCLDASGHGLKPLDVECMKQLCDKVNIVPVITKSDTLTSEECSSLKERILKEMRKNDIKIYDFPELPEDDERYELNHTMRKKVPYAVIGSNTVLEIDGKRVRGREYPWGTVDIEDPNHCDFDVLKTMLMYTHMEDLKEVTHNVHYENYRYHRLVKIAGVEGSLIENCKNSEKLEKLELEHKEKLDRIEVEHMKNLMKYEAQFKREAEEVEESLQQKWKELEKERKMFELAKEAWEDGLLGIH